MTHNSEDLLVHLQSRIATLVADFEQSTDIRLDKLELDNRMRHVGCCSVHHIIVTADIDYKELKMPDTTMQTYERLKALGSKPELASDQRKNAF